jgi:hypothetical protein
LISQKQNTITSARNITLNTLTTDTLKICTNSVTKLLNGKQNTILDDGLSISKISGLQSALNNRALVSYLTSFQNTLNGEQNTITNYSLNIAHITQVTICKTN